MFNFTSLCVEPALLAKCSTLTKNPIIAAVNLSLVSKICHKIINSKEFFEAIIMPLGLKFKLDLKNNFKENYFSLRKIYLVDTQLFQCNKNSIFFSRDRFSDNFYRSFNVPFNFSNVNLKESYFAGCNRYLAANKKGTPLIDIYTIEGEVIRQLHLSDRVLQIAWVDHLLCVVTSNHEILVFNLEKLNKPKIIPLPFSDVYPGDGHSFENICFGKKYLIYTQSIQIFALPISFLKEELNDKPNWISKNHICYSKCFPKEDDFIQVIVAMNNQIDLKILSIVNQIFSESIIVRNIPFSPIPGQWMGDFIFYHNRLVISYKGENSRQIFSYDCITKCIDTVNSDESSNAPHRITCSPY